ncbi:MAG: YraN family protein [Bacteroidota bacterium]
METNWHYQRMELDLIAKDQNTLVFVEVKTRSKDHHLPPEAAVDSRKEQRIVRAALAYMHHTNYEWAIRFDIIAIVEKGVDRYSIQHLEDAFFPS